MTNHPSDLNPRPQLQTAAASWGPKSLLPADAGTRTAHPATGPSLGQVLMSIPIIATTPCADFRCALDRFVGCTYRPRVLPGTAGWQTCGHSLPVRRRISPVPCSAVQTFRSPCAGRFLGVAPPRSSPRPWPSPRGKGLGSVSGPPKGGRCYDAAGFTRCYGPLARSTPKGLCRDASALRISPRAGHQLHGCLVITVAGLPPASRTQLPGRTTPINASPTPSRTPAHDSRPPWIATPSM